MNAVVESTAIIRNIRKHVGTQIKIEIFEL